MTAKIKLGIIGPSSFEDEAYFNFAVNDFINAKSLNHKNIEIITGNGNGAFKLARDFAEEQSYNYEIKIEANKQHLNNSIAKDSDYLIAFASSKMVGIPKSISIFVEGNYNKNSRVSTLWIG